MLEALSLPAFSLDHFFWRSLIGGVLLSLLTGPLGCVVVWRRMAYFGESLGHSTLLGVALAWMAHLPVIPVVALCCAVFAVLLSHLRRASVLAMDTLLGLMSHAILAVGLLVISMLPGIRVDISAFLFGDILSISREDIWLILVMSVLGLGVLHWLWRPMLVMIFSEELAVAEGIPTRRVDMYYTLLMALVIAVAMHMVGVLLVVALLIIPAAAAHRLAHTPERMAVFATIISALSVMGGLWLSLLADVPTGPAIVATATVLFLLGLAKRARV